MIWYTWHLRTKAKLFEWHYTTLHHATPRHATYIYYIRHPKNEIANVNLVVHSCVVLHEHNATRIDSNGWQSNRVASSKVGCVEATLRMGGKRVNDKIHKVYCISKWTRLKAAWDESVCESGCLYKMLCIVKSMKVAKWGTEMRPVIIYS